MDCMMAASRTQVSRERKRGTAIDHLAAQRVPSGRDKKKGRPERQPILFRPHPAKVTGED
jgi:hypothetical protein